MPPPSPSGSVALPIDARLVEIREAVKKHHGLVLSAEAGAGKTTRVPPALLDLVPGQILVTEPRRLAARMAARRVAEELGGKVGQCVGYSVRFERKVGPDTRIIFMTEGVLLRRLAEDPLLKGVGAVVFDELHERHLQGDLALALTRRAQKERATSNSLILLAMSATLDAAPVSEFLCVPHLHVEGRTFPVTIEYQDSARPLEDKVHAALKETFDKDTDKGDVLVFLPGAREIRHCASRVQKLCRARNVELHTLHGSMKAEAQDRALKLGAQKVILATNVAESSVTAPGVTTVIDSGLARVASMSPWTGLPSLRVEKVSQASATQRAGRAGRIRPGHCVRLFSERDFLRRDEHTRAEIMRLDLAELCLMLLSRGEDPRAFDYFERPPAAAFDSAMTLLSRLGAVKVDSNHHEKFTELGHRLSKIPAHPRLAAIIEAGRERGVAARACSIAAILAERPVKAFETTKRAGETGTADVLTALSAYEEAFDLNASELRARGIDASAMATLKKSERQLLKSIGACAPTGFVEGETPQLAEAIVTGFCDRVGRLVTRKGKRHLVFADGSALLHEDSVVRGEFAAALRVEDRTERGGRGQALVFSACETDLDMLFELFGNAMTTKTALRFDDKTEQVEAVERLSLHGLIVDEAVSRDVIGAEVSECLKEAAENAGLSKFFKMDEVEQLELRIAFLSSRGFNIDGEALLDDALSQLCEHRRSFGDLRGASLVNAMLAALDDEARRTLSKHAPTHIALPRRRRVPVNYEQERPPWIASRLQDFFGLAEGPVLAGEPLVLHLLAPNMRAVQLTTDLAGFWERHYPSLRKQLSRRYPKHDWREDPLV